MLTTIDPDLFVRPDGLPIVFVLEDADSPKWSLVRDQVEEGGGVLLSESSEDGQSSWINLASSSMPTRSRRSSSTKKVYSISYVTECIRQNALLPTLEAFTFGLLAEKGQDHLLNLTLGVNPKIEKTQFEEGAIVKAGEVKDEYVEMDLVKEEPKPEMDVEPASQEETRSQSRGVNVVNRVAKKPQKKVLLRFGDPSFQRKEYCEPSDVQDENVCQHCERTFEDSTKLERHIDTSHNTKYYSCHHCNEGFRRKFTLQNHMKENHKDELQKCGTCNKSFHVQAKQQEAECPSQPITPEEQEDDDEMEETRGGVKEPEERIKRKENEEGPHFQAMMALPWKCVECGKLFNRLSNMNQHIKKIHREVKSKICQICSETFKNREQLSRHKLTHPEFEVPFTCKHCSQPFGEVGLMNAHIKQRHNPKRFECNQCKQTFTTAHSVLLHTNSIHNKEKFSCEYCGQLFTQKGSMTYHMQVHNSVKKESFDCVVCGMKFARVKLLNIHADTHKEKSYKCDECDYLGKTKTYLRKHKESHTSREQQHICSLCDLAYLGLAGLKKHQQMKHGMHGALEKNLICHYCEKAFPYMAALKTHMGTHGETPYSCRLCPKSFRNAYRRELHERDEHQIERKWKRMK